jgi:hypothetical protein
MNRVVWGSTWDGHSRAPLRVGIATIAAVELLVESAQVDWQSRDPVAYPPRGGLAEGLATIPGAAWLIYAMILLGLVALATDRRPILAGAWALLWAGLLSEWQTQIFGSPSRNAFFPGAVLLGWILGQAWARATSRAAGTTAGRAFRERLAEAGALACLAAAYVGSGGSKLLSAGLGWTDGAQVRALILEQQPVASWAWLASYRDAMVEHPSMAAGAAAATLVIETGAVLLLLGPRLRLAWAAVLLGLHLNIILLCAMPYLEPMLLLVLFVVPWPRVFGRRRIPEPDSSLHEHRPAAPRLMVLILVGIIAAAWLLAPWGWRGEHVDPNPPFVEEGGGPARAR